MLFLIFTEELHGGCHILSCDQMTSNMIGPLHAISFPGRLRIAEWQNVVCTLSIRISFCIKYRVYSYKFYSSNYVLNDICFVLTVRPEGHAIVRCKTWVCHELAYFHYWPWVPPFCMQWAWKIQIFKCQLIHSTIVQHYTFCNQNMQKMSNVQYFIVTFWHFKLFVNQFCRD